MVEYSLNSLPEDQRAVILLVSVEDLGYAEAARVLGVPIGTVMSRLARGRERMRELVQEKGRPSLRRVEVTGPGRPIAEEDLHAYVDGLLDAERRAAVERYLQSSADTAERVTVYTAQRNELRTALAARAHDPIPPNLNLARLLEANLRRRRRPWRAAAAILLAVGLGAGAGWVIGQRPPTGVAAIAREAAMSYAVYAVDKRRPVEVWAAQKEDLTRWLTNLAQPAGVPTRPVQPAISATGRQTGCDLARPRGVVHV